MARDKMFNLEIHELGTGRVHLGRVGKNVQKAILKEGFKDIRREIIKGAVDIRNDAIQGIRTSPKTGKLYYKYGKGGNRKMHRASSPGRPPRTDTGALISSIIIDDRFTLDGIEVEVGSNITDPPYPVFLEFGTDEMAARPWLEPPVLKHKNLIVTRVSWAIRNAAKRISLRG